MRKIILDLRKILSMFPSTNKWLVLFPNKCWTEYDNRFCKTLEEEDENDLWRRVNGKGAKCNA